MRARQRLLGEHLPIDKPGADLLFQIISERYERASLVLITNQPYKAWPKIFDNDATLTRAVLDRPERNNCRCAASSRAIPPATAATGASQAGNAAEVGGLGVNRESTELDLVDEFLA